VLNSLQHYAPQTVSGIALRNSIAVATAHRISTEHYVYDKWAQRHMKCIRIHGVYIEMELRCHNNINVTVTF